MADAPERIWADRAPRRGWMFRPEKMSDSQHEYVRADLAPTDAQVMAHPKVRALVERGDDVIRASNTLMLMLAGELPLTKPSLEAAIRRTLDARNAWDNARAALRDLETP